MPILPAMNSLGLDKQPKDTRVVVAMSGGVDSSVTAAWLVEQGYEVVGITLQLYDHGAAVGKKGACCAGQDIYDASQVAEKLGIPHYVLDYESRFREEVMQAFADSYVRGETPVPCVLCNRTVKFRDLLATARDLGAEALATGHYVRRRAGENGPELLRGADASRDQSYFLFGTTREQLELLRFPLGDLSKDETRAMARRFDLPVASKPDSQDICFVPDGNYARVVEKLRPEAAEPGEIVHVDGSVLGRHQGIIHFTVGQRRGLGIGGRREDQDSEPLFVLKLDPQRRQVVVGPRTLLGQSLVELREINWLASTPPNASGEKVLVRLRSMQALVPATLFMEGEAGRVVLDQPQAGVSPGQACVFYDFSHGERVLGGGWICRRDATMSESAAA
jgi:tRNA-specific 2-thiouridylase